jgi:hypothetical protein
MTQNQTQQTTYQEAKPYLVTLWRGGMHHAAFVQSDNASANIRDYFKIGAMVQEKMVLVDQLWLPSAVLPGVPGQIHSAYRTLMSSQQKQIAEKAREEAEKAGVKYFGISQSPMTLDSRMILDLVNTALERNLETDLPTKVYDDHADWTRFTIERDSNGHVKHNVLLLHTAVLLYATER